MSQINCDACQDLRETSPEFIQNGVTENIATSLKNNTGLNPALTVLHTDCEDLNDTNDCMIGRMVSEVEAYEVCDWKKFMKKFIQNLYETLKAIIASICGLWIRTDRLCASIDNLFGLIGGENAKPHNMEWVSSDVKAKFSCNDPFDNDLWRFTLQSEFRNGSGCDAQKRQCVFRVMWQSNDPHPPHIFSFRLLDSLQRGTIIAKINKSEVVPADMPESLWNSLMRGWWSETFVTFNGNSIVRVGLKGYIVIDGVVFNDDLRETYGEGVMVMYVTDIIGETPSGWANNMVDDLSVQII